MISFPLLIAFEALGYADGWYWAIWLGAFFLDGTLWSDVGKAAIVKASNR